MSLKLVTLDEIQRSISMKEAISTMEKAFIQAYHGHEKPPIELKRGAISGLATKYFSRKNSRHVAIIGAGTQAMVQLRAVSAVRNIQHVSVWSKTDKKAQNLAERLRNVYKVQCVESVAQAVKNADIICTVGKHAEALIQLQDIKPYAHINALGSTNYDLSELSKEMLFTGIIVVEEIDSELIIPDESISTFSFGQVDEECFIELGEWLSHKNVDYTSCLTIFKPKK